MKARLTVAVAAMLMIGAAAEKEKPKEPAWKAPPVSTMSPDARARRILELIEYDQDPYERVMDDFLVLDQSIKPEDRSKAAADYKAAFFLVNVEIWVQQNTDNGRKKRMSEKIGTKYTVERPGAPPASVQPKKNP